MKKILLSLLLVPSLMFAMDGEAPQIQPATIQEFKAYLEVDNRATVESAKSSLFWVTWYCVSKPVINVLSRSDSDTCALSVALIGAGAALTNMFLKAGTFQELDTRRQAVSTIIGDAKTDYSVKDTENNKTLADYFYDIEKRKASGLAEVIEKRKLAGILGAIK
jgi:hypothetical protein